MSSAEKSYKDLQVFLAEIRSQLNAVNSSLELYCIGDPQTMLRFNLCNCKHRSSPMRHIEDTEDVLRVEAEVIKQLKDFRKRSETRIVLHIFINKKK